MSASIFAIVATYGAAMKTWILIPLVIFEGVFLMYDQAVIARAYRAAPNGDVTYDHVHGAVKLYMDSVTIVTTIATIMMEQ